MTILRAGRYREFTGIIAGLMWTLATAQATPGAPAQIPLFVASSAPANIMLLLDTSGSMNTNVDGDTRLDVAKAAAIQLLDSLENVRVGVAAFDPSNSGKNGAELLHQVADLASHEAAIKAAINGLSATGYTPLAEAMHDIGRYFSGFGGTVNPGNQESTSCSANGQYDGSLTLHPDSSPVSIDDDTVFHHSPALASGVSSQSPICHWCQKNFVIVLTDGNPY